MSDDNLSMYLYLKEDGVSYDDFNPPPNVLFDSKQIGSSILFEVQEDFEKKLGDLTATEFGDLTSVDINQITFLGFFRFPVFFTNIETVLMILVI